MTRLIDADALKREQMKAFNCESATKYGNTDAKQQEQSYSTIMLYEVSDIIEDTIDNAPTVDIQTAVWELYERHQSHLATYVYEFGIELRELLYRYGGGRQ